MHAIATFLLSFLATTWAYSVLTPNDSVGWVNQGSNNLTWTRVDTDPLNFTVVLTNQNMSGFQSEVLAALVDGTLGFTRLNPHNGGWPTGSHFRVNLVKDDLDLNSILAQSPEFDITEANSTSTTGTASFSFGTTATGTATTPTQSGSSGASQTNPITVPTGGAASSYPVQTGLLALFSLLGFALA